MVQQGDLHRLVSPIGSPVGAVAYVGPDGDAVVFAYRLEPSDLDDPALDLTGLGLAGELTVEDATPGDPARGSTIDAVAWPSAEAPSAKVWLVRPAP